MSTGPQQILFKFHDHAAGAEIASSLQTISGLKGLFNARAVPGAGHDAAAKNLFVAEIDHTADAQGILQAVKAAPHVEYATLPPTRRLPPPQRR